MSGDTPGEWKTPERDKAPVSGWAVTAVLAGALFVFTVFGWLTWRQLQAREAHLLPAGPREPRRLDSPEVNLVNTGLIVLDTRADEEKAAEARRLHGEGWVDRDAGVVHLPIEQGIERVLSGQRPGGEAGTP
ncbi:hypothetical protein [Melittangium boletus]|uniref:Uncharacterized protein n=1 Tax=Melittangium boletus DSM 14713 TaxID=1294270 RepID=A0A250IF73_9BACT|nr:hypothetical protein [Melittangium boletus]ATB29791.1 hypothetical protein MEBOL_003246 [Melittangium boletus DSM 14713]